MPAVLSIKPDSIQIQTPVPSPSVSNRYSFLPTATIVNTMLGSGWQYDSGTARASRDPARRPYAFHVLRFSNPNMPEVAPGVNAQAVVQNSHDAGHAFRIDFGLFRIACANGMIVQSASVGGIRRSHMGYSVEQLRSDLDDLLERAPDAFRQVREWREIQTSADDRMALASRMGRLRWKTGCFQPYSLLEVRRSADAGDDLWTVFNRVQEGVIRGGISVSGVSEAGRHYTRRAAAVRGVQSDLELNREMWRIGQEIADEIVQN